MKEWEKDISRAIGLLRAAGRPDKYLEQKYEYLKSTMSKLKLSDALSKYFKDDPIIKGRFLCIEDNFSAFNITGVIIHLKKVHSIYVKKSDEL